jgi:hypothetical protein
MAERPVPGGESAAPYQQLATTIVDAGGQRALQFLVYPSRPRQLRSGVELDRHWALWEQMRRASNERGLKDPEPDSAGRYSIPQPDVVAVATAMGPRNERGPTLFAGSRTLQQQFALALLQEDDDARVQDVQRFVTGVLYQPVVPFRRNPIRGETLASLLVGASGPGAGAVAGYFAGAPHGLLVLITVPGGMIIGGAASGVARALETGLHRRVLRLIDPPDPLSPTSPAALQGSDPTALPGPPEPE